MEYKQIRNAEIGVEPSRQYPGDVGLDLTASRHAVLHPNTRVQVPSNIAVAIPPGYAGLVLPRSSTFQNKGLVVHPGLIDSGYRGEIQVLAWNPSTARSVKVDEGDRIAQIVLIPVFNAKFELVEDLPAGDREEAGFGSTGGQGDPRVGPTG